MRRKILIGALALLGVILLAVIALIIWLHTGMGERTVAGYVAGKARDAIKGDLRVRGIEVGGLLHVCVDDLELRDPDGHKALTAERACVRISPLALRSHRVVLSEGRLEKPWIEIAKVPGTQETTLQRAIAPRVESTPAGPLQWIIEVQDLQLHRGAATVRPELGEPANFALEDLEIPQARARYAAGGAAAALQLSAQLAAPGRLPIQLDLDATLDGAPATGKVSLRALKLGLGRSGLALSGWWDLARNAGALELRELAVEPRDLEAALKKTPLAGAVHGE